MINRVMDGWVSDEDVDAIEKICASVGSSGELDEIRARVYPRTIELSDFGQRTRVRIALYQARRGAPAGAR